MTKWITFKDTLNMISASYHLTHRLWWVLLSPFFRRWKLDSDWLTGFPDVAELRADRAEFGTQVSVALKPMLLTTTAKILLVSSRK